MIGLPVHRPEVRFDGEEDLRRVCLAAQVRLEDYALELSLAAAQLQKSLGQVPDGTLVGVHSKIRARLVTAHLRTAARVAEMAAGYAGGCYAAFCRVYARERGVR